MKIKNINRISRLRHEVLLLYNIYVKGRQCFNQYERGAEFKCGYCAYCLADEALEGDWDEK